MTRRNLCIAGCILFAILALACAATGIMCNDQTMIGLEFVCSFAAAWLFFSRNEC